MSLWLLCILTWTLTWIQTKCAQAHKQQINYAWAFKNRTQNHSISQNLHKQIHANQAPATSSVKDINKWSGMQGHDLHGFSSLLSQGSLILSMFIDFNDMIRAQYWVDDPSACTTAWHRILIMLLMSWPAENKRHNSIQKNMFFIDSSWPLVLILQLFKLRTYPIL